MGRELGRGDEVGGNIISRFVFLALWAWAYLWLLDSANSSGPSYVISVGVEALDPTRPEFRDRPASLAQMREIHASGSRRLHVQNSRHVGESRTVTAE